MFACGMLYFNELIFYFVLYGFLSIPLYVPNTYLAPDHFEYLGFR